MTIYEVQCLRVSRETPQKMGQFSMEVEAEFPNEALQYLIDEFLPPVGIPTRYFSEFSRPAELKADSKKHFVSYQLDSLTTRDAYFLSCQYTLPETLDRNPKLKRPRAPKKNAVELAKQHQKKIDQIVKVYNEDQFMKKLLRSD